MSDLVVRPAGPPDLPAVHRLLDEAAAWLVGRGIPQWRPHPRGSTERASAAGTLWVGTRDERPVAALRLVPHDPEAAMVAAERGCAALRLDCWAGNARLRRFYEEAGFRRVDDVDVAGERCSRFEWRPLPGR